MLRKIIAVTLTDFGVKYQRVLTKSEPACETMINWAKEIAEEYDMSLKDFAEIEKDIRLSCYHGSEEDIDIDLGKYVISYREFTMDL